MNTHTISIQRIGPWKSNVFSDLKTKLAADLFIISLFLKICIILYLGYLKLKDQVEF